MPSLVISHAGFTFLIFKDDEDPKSFLYFCNLFRLDYCKIVLEMIHSSIPEDLPKNSSLLLLYSCYIKKAVLEGISENIYCCQ